MRRYLNELARQAAAGSSEYLSRVTPILRKRLNTLNDYATQRARTASSHIKDRYPRTAGVLEATAPQIGIAVVLAVAMILIVFMANLAGSHPGETRADAVTAAAAPESGRAAQEDQSSRSQERAAEAQPPAPAEVKPVKPPKADSGWAAPSSAAVSDGYGPRGWRDGEMHWGMDFAANQGDEVYAADDGTVVMAQEYGGYGNCVVIKHADGVQTLYGHFSELKVSAGDNVSTGDLIGKAGATGDSTGPHLHFEVSINGDYTDPAQFLKSKDVAF